MTNVAQLVALETHHLPFPPIIFGLLAFVCLLVMMAIVLSIGKGRPHS
jgi:hypothetical protein